MKVEQQFQSAVAHHQAGRLAEAERICRHILAQSPNHPGALELAGLLAVQTQRPDVAIEFIGRAIAIQPHNPFSRNNLGKAFNDLGRLDEAIAAWREAIRLQPDFFDAYYNLGIALQRTGRLDEAIEICRRAVELKPDHALSRLCLGNALKHAKRLPESIDAYRQALRLRPDFAEAHNNLGIVLKDAGQLDEAIAAYREAIRLKPDYAAAFNNLGNALNQTGRLDDAIAAYRHALKFKPDFSEAHSNLVYNLHFHPSYDAGMIYEEHRRWNQLQAEPLRSLIAPHSNNRDLDRRLRIGYVSPDFRDHVLAFSMMPVFLNRDRQAFEIFCYSNVSRPDAVTERIRACANVWQPIVGMSNSQIAEKIREDQIDVLIDATMHMAQGRPLIFARKPAPVQVAWLAYPGTTGLGVMDYRLTDPYLDPPGVTDRFYSETSIRLPHSFWCYDPLTAEPTVGELPAKTAGHVTFGCLNNFCKINDGVLRLWAQVLKTVPESRLVLLCPEGSHRQAVFETFRREKVAIDRIEMIAKLPRLQYLEVYRRIDVGLDSFPYNGHTTSLDSYWMGVPVVTLVGQTVVGRAGLSQLSNLGLTELAAATPEQYIQIASSLAADLTHLAELRRTLRGRMQASPLMDGAGFVRNLEAAFRQMWRRFVLDRVGEK